MANYFSSVAAWRSYRRADAADGAEDERAPAHDRPQDFLAGKNGARDEKAQRHGREERERREPPPESQHPVQPLHGFHHPGRGLGALGAADGNVPPQRGLLGGEMVQLWLRIHARSAPISFRVADNGPGWRAMKRRKAMMIATSAAA